MKKILLALFMLLFASGMCAKADISEIVYDEFNYEYLVSSSHPDKSVRGPWVVSGDGHTLETENSNTYIKLNYYGKDGVTGYASNAIEKKITPVETSALIEFDFKQTETKTNDRIAAIRGKNVSDGERAVAYIEIIDGNIVCRADEDRLQLMLIENYELNKWYKFMFVVDIESRFFDVYVDEVKKNDTLVPFFQPVVKMDSFKLGGRMTEGGTVCIDNVRIKTAEHYLPSIKNISIKESDSEIDKLNEGNIKSTLCVENLAQPDGINAVLVSALYKDGIIVDVDTSDVNQISFVKHEKLQTELTVDSITETSALKHYLFDKINTNDFYLVDAVVTVNKDEVVFGNGSFSNKREDNLIEANLEKDDRDISLSGSLKKDSDVAMIVLKPDKSIVTDGAEAILRIENTVCDESGMFAFDFTMNDDCLTGEYTVLLSSNEILHNKEFSFVYINETEKSMRIGEMDLLDKDALMIYVADPSKKMIFEAMDMLVQDYYTSDQDWICKYLIANKGTGFSEDGFSDLFNQAVVLSNIKDEVSTSELYNTLLSHKNILSIDIENKAFKNIEFQNNVMNKLMEYEYEPSSSYQDFLDFYNNALVTELLNETEHSAMKSFISSYNNILKIDMSTFDMLSEYYQTEVLKKFSELTFSEIIVEINGETNISNQFNSIASEKLIIQNNKNDLSNGSDSGSSGGGGRGGITISTTPQKPTDDSKETAALEIKLPFKDISEKHWAYDDLCSLYDKGVINGVTNDEIQPDAFVTREQYVKMIVSGFFRVDSAATCDFSDVKKDDWFYGAVATAYHNALINGYGEKFGTGENLTRQDAAVILKRVADVIGIELPKKNENMVIDIEQVSSYAKEDVSVLVGSGLISGNDAGYFMPERFITRAETAKLINRLFELQ